MSVKSAGKDLVGRKVGAYILEKKIGEGGFADVYLAHHESGRDWRVAIKVLRREGRSEKEITDFRKRFETEARVCFQYNLPRVVRIFEKKVRDLDDRPCQVMEYIEGGSLQEWIECVRNGQMPPIDEDEAVRFGLEIAESLAALHEKGLIHRDVKPSNILLNAERHALLSDLGLVQTAGSRIMREKRGSLAKEAVGDPLYCPPEQAAGKPSDFSADVYMWGATLFELLTLKKFFYNEKKRVRDVRPDISTWLDEVLAVALRKDPAERFQSMDAVLESLRQHQVVAGPKPILSRMVDVPSMRFPGNRLIHRPEQIVEVAEVDWETTGRYFWQGRLTTWLTDGMEALERAHDWPLADQWRLHLERGERLLHEQREDLLARSAGLIEFLSGFENFHPPQMETEEQIDLGELEIGEERDGVVQVTNTGGGVLEFRVRSENPALAVAEPERVYALQAMETQAITVRFAPDERFLTEIPALSVRLESNVEEREIPVAYAIHKPLLEKALAKGGAELRRSGRGRDGHAHAEGEERGGKCAARPRGL